MEEKRKAFILNGDSYPGLHIARSLGKRGIPVVTFELSGSDFGTSKYITETISPEKGETRLDALFRLGEREERKLVLYPTEEAHIRSILEHEKALRKYFLFPGEEYGNWKRFTDYEKIKSLTNSFGIPTPDEVALTDAKLRPFLNSFPYPFLGIRKDRREMRLLKRPTQVEEFIREKGDRGEDYRILRHIPGGPKNIYTFCGYFGEHSELMGYGIYRHIQREQGTFGDPLLVLQQWNEEIYDFSKSVLQQGELRGYGECTFKEDPTTKNTYLLDVRLSFGVYTRLFLELNLDFPYLYYLDVQGLTPDHEKKFLNYNTGTYGKLRIPDVKKTGKEPSLSSRLFSKQVGGLWDSKDPGPALTFTSNALQKKFWEGIKNSSPKKRP